MQQHRYLKVGETIKIGDSFQRKSGEWVTLSDEHHITMRGKPIKVDFGDLPVRRPVDNRGRDLAGEVQP